MPEAPTGDDRYSSEFGGVVDQKGSLGGQAP